MSSNEDDFADIIFGQGNVGVFGSTEAALDNGFQRFLEVQTDALPQGVALEFRCEGCPKHRRLLLEYPEAIALSNGLDPARAFAPNVPLLTPQGAQGAASSLCSTPPASWIWRRDEGAWGLKQTCECSWHYTVRLKPNELDQLLRKAKAGSFLTQRDAIADAHCKLLRQSQRRG